MRPYRTLLVIIVMVFLGGALLAPWIYWAVQTLDPASALAHKPFHRFVDRALLGLGLLAIWPLLRSVEAKSWRDLGLCRPEGQWMKLCAGIALGVGSLACVPVVLLGVGARRLNPDLSAIHFFAALGGAVGTAAMVAVMEEMLFRGAIFGALRRGGPWPLALLVSSAFYAVVHFLGKNDPTGPIVWYSGLKVLLGMLQNFENLRTVVPGFFNLALAGVILGVAYQRSGNLYFSMGLHGGWVFWLKFYTLVTIPATEGNPWLWGSEKLVDGWLAMPLLLLTLALIPQFAPPAGERGVA